MEIEVAFHLEIGGNIMVSGCYTFNTKFVQDSDRNGQKCWITEVTHVARNSQQDLVIVRFKDGHTTECYRNELL